MVVILTVITRREGSKLDVKMKVKVSSDIGMFQKLMTNVVTVALISFDFLPDKFILT